MSRLAGEDDFGRGTIGDGKGGASPGGSHRGRLPRLEKLTGQAPAMVKKTIKVARLTADDEFDTGTIGAGKGGASSGVRRRGRLPWLEKLTGQA